VAPLSASAGGMPAAQNCSSRRRPARGTALACLAAAPGVLGRFPLWRDANRTHGGLFHPSAIPLCLGPGRRWRGALDGRSDGSRRRVITGLIVFHFSRHFHGRRSGSGPAALVGFASLAADLSAVSRIPVPQQRLPLYSPGARSGVVSVVRLYYTDADGKEQGEWFKVSEAQR